MDTDEVTQLIRERGGFSSAEETRTAVSEVLNVLGSRDLGGEAENLAAQLPQGMGELLVAQGEPAEKFGAEEFFRRVRTNLDISEEQAQHTVRAVLSSVADAVTEGERAKFINSLPNDLSDYALWT